MLVSLQFKAEKAEYVETLATKVNQIDEDRQKKEAETKDEFEGMAKTSFEEINALKISVHDSFEVLHEEVSKEKAFTKSEFEDIAHNHNLCHKFSNLSHVYHWRPNTGKAED